MTQKFQGGYTCDGCGVRDMHLANIRHQTALGTMLNLAFCSGDCVRLFLRREAEGPPPDDDERRVTPTDCELSELAGRLDAVGTLLAIRDACPCESKKCPACALWTKTARLIVRLGHHGGKYAMTWPACQRIERGADIE